MANIEQGVGTQAQLRALNPWLSVRSQLELLALVADLDGADAERARAKSRERAKARATNTR